MFRKLIITSFFCILSQVSAAGAYDVVAVKSLNIPPYNEALRGFKNTCGCSVKELPVSEMEPAGILRETGRAGSMTVLAIGRDALEQVKDLGVIPVIYAMVSEPQAIIQGAKNISGVSMDIPFERQLTELLKILPDIKRIGLVYDPVESSPAVQKLTRAAKARGIEVIANKVDRHDAVPAAISLMKRGIDVFWMLPDTTVVTPGAFEFMLMFSFESRVPILTFSKKYAEMGAFMSIQADAFHVGEQAGELFKKRQAGPDAGKPARADTDKTVLSINAGAAHSLGITLPADILKRANITGRLNK